MGYWLNDTSGDDIEIYADNDKLYFYAWEKFRPPPGQSICKTHVASHRVKQPFRFYEKYKKAKKTNVETAQTTVSVTGDSCQQYC